MATGQVMLIRAPNPGPLTGPGTNTWVFGSGESLVIDPGPANEAHLSRVAEAARTVGPVIAIACTHHHTDHLEGAARLSEMTGAPLAVHFQRTSQAGDLPLHDGDRLLVGRVGLTAIHTPGHASDHLCFFDEISRRLFTGDHVLQGTTSLVVPPDGDMAAYLDSLERVLKLGPLRIHPGHGEVVEDGEAAIRELIDHRLRREAQILDQLRGGAAAPEDLVPRLYSSYPSAVLGMAAGTVHAHLLKLEREGRVRRLAGDPRRFELAESA